MMLFISCTISPFSLTLDMRLYIESISFSKVIGHKDYLAFYLATWSSLEETDFFILSKFHFFHPIRVIRWATCSHNSCSFETNPVWLVNCGISDAFWHNSLDNFLKTVFLHALMRLCMSIYCVIWYD